MAPRRQESKLTLKSIWDPPKIREFLPEKHATKMWLWLIRHPNASIDKMPMSQWSFSESSKRKLTTEFVLHTTKIASVFHSARGDTTKLLVELQDGHQVESVIMRYDAYNAVCVSSQVGCQMGCRFCATGTMGIIGDLSAAEILEQLVHANRISKIRNVVFMGMGEPLNNFNNVKTSVELMINTKIFALSPKHVTVSTVGVTGNMRRLTLELPHVQLALSLHAPNQDVRSRIVPAASGSKFERLIEAVDFHINQTGALQQTNDLVYRSGVMIEYILIKGVNDLAEHAHELGRLFHPRRRHILVNLIPYNPTEVAENYEAPTPESVEQFKEICMSAPYNLHTRVRREFGQDIAGACGQLALTHPSNTFVKEGTRDIEDTLPVSKSKSSRSIVSTSSVGATACAFSGDSSSSHGHDSSTSISSASSRIGEEWNWLAKVQRLLVPTVAALSLLGVGLFYIQRTKLRR